MLVTFLSLALVQLITAQQITFSCTGNLQSYVVPSNAIKMDAVVCGARGGSSYGGSGQRISLTGISLTPGQTFYLAVGCTGTSQGGYNGGGAGAGYGYGGGGASDIRTSSSSLSSRIVVAAGGGGAGFDGSRYYSGGSGNTSSGSGSGYGSLATMSAGGAGGKYFGYPNGYSGSFGTGGAASSNGGGGGGGWYGGGGATYYGGGGGGSSYFSVGTKKSTSTNYNTDGSIKLTLYSEYTITLSNSSSSTYLYFPSDVTSLNVTMAGAQGGSTSTGTGGKGAYLSATLTGSFTSGIRVYVGGTNGYPGGGKPTYAAYCREGGVGGGYSSVAMYVNSYFTTVLVAGGGGGAGYDPYCGSSCTASSINGGNGGPTGSNGLASPVMTSSYGGKGGGSTAGGAGGYYNSSYGYGSAGYSYSGGSPSSDTCGGGGGGGYNGGGGGSFTGGGGGSSYYYSSASAVSRVVQVAGSNTGNGFMTITYVSAMSNTPSFRPTYAPAGTSSDSSSSGGVSGGDAAAAVLVPLFFIACCCYCCYKHGKNQSSSSSSYNYNTSSSTPSTAVTTRANPVASRPKKIDSAVSVMNTFLSSMMGARDRCSVVSFSDNYNIRQNLSTSSACIASLNSCRYATGGGTALYDAAVVSVLQFVGTADKARPWILIILTDGEDTSSKTKPHELIEVLKAFNQPSSNFIFVIGLGQSLQDTELRRICNQSNSMYLRATDIETMQLMFALIALVVIEQNQVEIARVQAEGVDAIFARARTARAVATVPIDIIVLLDTSGSMNDPA